MDAMAFEVSRDNVGVSKDKFRNRVFKTMDEAKLFVYRVHNRLMKWNEEKWLTNKGLSWDVACSSEKVDGCVYHIRPLVNK